MVRDIILPKLGQTMQEGTIVEWLKQEGDEVSRGEVLFTTESDKATLEVEAPGKGYLRRILVPAGEAVPVLTVVALMTRTLDEDIAGYEGQFQVSGFRSQVEEAAEAVPAEAEAGEETRFFGKNLVSERVFASPRARKLARERGVDLALVTGTGPNDRIAERDVVAYLEALPKATPVARRLAEQAGVDLRAVRGSGPGGRVSKEDVERALEEFQVPGFGLRLSPKGFRSQVEEAAVSAVSTPEAAEPETLKPISGVRAVVARRMFESHQATAPVTLTTEADASALVEVRERLKASMADELGFNLGYNDLLIKLVARALREFPYMNARLEGDHQTGAIRQLSEINVALAVDTERGLLVPVVRDADRKGLVEIAREVRDLIERAQAGMALPDELSGSTFTITNLGMYEIDAFTPIVNLPETAILGVGQIKPRPAVVDGEVCARQMVWLSLTFDHRLVNGAPVARFLRRIKQLVEEPYLLLG
jgi:pyruvate dehydrogenase E2 component (dihydrolipoamide acetyltransferase)